MPKKIDTEKPILTAEQLLAADPIKETAFELEVPLLGGKVRCRLLRSAQEWDDLLFEIFEATSSDRKYDLGDGSNIVLSNYKRLAQHYVWLARCLVEPKLTIPQLVKIGHRTGDMLVNLSMEVQNRNYATTTGVAQAMERLKEDPTSEGSPRAS